MTRPVVILFAVTYVSLCSFGIYLAHHSAPKVKRINCSIAEISPDFTPEMRAQCRAIKGERLL
jgi:hypothetical protein